MSKQHKPEVQYCDDCCDVLGLHIIVFAVLPFNVSSANKGESAILCKTCYDKHLATKYWETNDTK